MAAPFRIQKPQQKMRNVYPKGGKRPAAAVAAEPQLEFKFYLDRLLKLIPAEVLGLYLVGSSLIPEGQAIPLAIWTVICLGGVVALRAYGTADPAERKKTDWIHVAISGVAFLIWVYTLGGVFRLWNIYVPYLGALLVLAWTFFVPIFYKGPAS